MSENSPQRTSLVAWLLAIPVLLLGILIGYLIWEIDVSIFTKLGYTAGFLLAGYWLYTPRSPNQIIARQVIALVVIWGLLVLFALTFAMLELRPELFEGYDPSVHAEQQTTTRMVFAFWGLVFGLGAFTLSWRIYKSLQRNLQLSSLFSRYVSPSVISQMLESREDFFTTQKIELSVMFVDLRGFTSTSENLAPDQVKELINTFMGVMIPLAHSWRGTVDKTVGDEIMVIFGAPLPYPDHADQAVQTAIAFLDAHAKVVDEWNRKHLPTLEMGIGINSGEMIIGNIGCDERVDYTVLGHHVNLGARLCGKAAGSEILISEFTREKLSNELARKVPQDEYVEIEAKGIKHAIKAFSIKSNPSG